MEVVMTIEKHYSVPAVAKALGKSKRTIRRWIEAGKVRAAELPGRFGKVNYAIPRSELERMGVSIIDVEQANIEEDEEEEGEISDLMVKVE